MSSAALTTAQLPRLRALLADWHATQPAPNPFDRSLDSIQTRFAQNLGEGKLNDDAKDIVVAFRTRPPLENEAATKFAQDGADPDADAATAEFCAGITLTSAEPGMFVAHTPGMKVADSSSPPLRVSESV